MGADLDAGQLQVAHAALQLLYREIDRLHGQRAEPDEAFGELGDDAGNVVVQPLRKIKGMRRLRPIREHDRHCGEHLYLDAERVALLKPSSRVPAIALNLPKALAVPQHARTARPMMFELDESAVAIPLPKIGPFLGQDVGMDIDLEHVYFGVSITVPHCLQVLFSSLA